MALKEQITAAAPIRSFEKGNLNTTLIRMNPTGRSYRQHCQRGEGCDEYQTPKDAGPFCKRFGIAYHGQLAFEISEGYVSRGSVIEDETHLRRSIRGLRDISFRKRRRE